MLVYAPCSFHIVSNFHNCSPTFTSCHYLKKGALKISSLLSMESLWEPFNHALTPMPIFKTVVCWLYWLVCNSMWSGFLERLCIMHGAQHFCQENYWVSFIIIHCWYGYICMLNSDQLLPLVQDMTQRPRSYSFIMMKMDTLESYSKLISMLCKHHWVAWLK